MIYVFGAAVMKLRIVACARSVPFSFVCHELENTAASCGWSICWKSQLIQDITYGTNGRLVRVDDLERSVSVLDHDDTP